MELQIEKKILFLRGHRVMLDTDLAALYGVPTGVLNQAVRRNMDRFPDDFMFQLTREEIERISQFVISSGGYRTCDLKRQESLRSQFVILEHLGIAKCDTWNWENYGHGTLLSFAEMRGLGGAGGKRKGTTSAAGKGRGSP
ncbi:MAG: ORF6N domain-containing protein [Candidatus Omnitrophota bacterium]|nr:ORF6N domain-containing protein [Candidatus Omnitrophota bacterium]